MPKEAVAPPSHRPTRVLFVCMGNICRSPTAHGVFQQFVSDAGLSGEIFVSSAGTIATHVGEAPDRRSQQHALRRRYDLSALRARHVTPEMISQADLVVAMDGANVQALQIVAAPADHPKIHRFLEFAPEAGHSDVPDPYYGGPEGFELVVDLCVTASRGLLAELVRGR